MKHWKQQFIPMLAISMLRKVFHCLLSLVMMFQMTGCQKKQVQNKILLGEWLELIVEKSGIQGYQQQQPYFINIPITSPYFNAVQSTVEWGVIDTKQALDLALPLTREWVAYTLLKLANKVDPNIQLQCKDAKQVQFPKEVASAISLGLMFLDRYHCFKPKEYVERNEALLWLEQMVTYMNHKVVNQPIYDIQIDEIKNIKVITYDKLKNEVILKKQEDVQKDDILHFISDNHDTYIKVEKIFETDTSKSVIGSEVMPEDLIQNIHIEDSFEIDFNQAEIEDIDEREHFHKNNQFVTPTYFEHLRERNFQFKDFFISYKIQKNGIVAEAKKRTNHGLEIYAKADIYNVKPTFKWNVEKGVIKEGYFKVDFKSSESLGSKRIEEISKRVNLKDITIHNFLSIAQKVIQNDDIQSDIHIPLCKIKVPLPQAPMIYLTAQIFLNLSADGKAEIFFQQSHTMGMDIRNNKLRIVHDHIYSHKNILRTSAAINAGMQFSLHCIAMELANITLFTGFNAEMNTSLHFYRNDGSFETKTTNLPSDYIDEMIVNHPDILMCTDLKAYVHANLNLNSSGTLAHYFGLHYQKTILDDKNGSLFPKLYSHLENFQFVNQCTRNSRNKLNHNRINARSNLLRLEKYSILLSPMDTYQIKLVEFPQGYYQNQLKFQVQNPNILNVSDNGLITAKQEGNTILKILTDDEKYSVSCHIQVIKG